MLKIMAIYVLDHRCDVYSYSHLHNLEAKYLDLSSHNIWLKEEEVNKPSTMARILSLFWMNLT